jgi:hypothetical protein
MPRFVVQNCLITLFVLSACSTSPALTGIPQVPPTDQTGENELLGRVVDELGAPVQQANIKTDTDVVLTDNDGWFHIPSSGYTEWVTVYKLGYISRTRAASPGVPVLIRVNLDDGKTLVLKFTGDVMFGRRFFDKNGDGNTEDGILPVNPSVGDHLNLLEPISPLLKDSDITAINLESVLDPQPYLSTKDPRPAAINPTKDDVYATHPNAMAALLVDGVNMIGLGNNHVYEMLDPGMANTLDFLTQLGLPHFGAGMNEDEAWAPAITTVNGEKIAFIGCTTIFSGGAAHCENNRLSTAVTEAKKESDLVIVMIHGGIGHDREIPAEPLRLSEIARKAGALIVVNHHPPLVSGFSWDEGKIVARSLGNFISDQTTWPSLESYLFTVYVRDGKVVRAFIEPVMLQDNIARGIASDLADTVTRDAAGLEVGPFVMESDTMEVDINQTSRQVSKSFSLDGGSGTLIQIPNGQWLSAFKGSGTLMIGRDLLWVGGFENDMVNNTPGFLPLWTQANTGGLASGAEFAYQGRAGLRLLRMDINMQDVVSSNIRRIPVQSGSRITISGMYRGSSGADPSLQVSWYSGTIGPSSSQIIKHLNVTTAGMWQYFQYDVQVPTNVVAMQPYLKLSPPVTGTVTVDFDNIRVIEWLSAEKPGFGPLYNFAYLIGQGELTLTQSVLPGGDPWLTVSDTDISNYIIQQTP